MVCLPERMITSLPRADYQLVADQCDMLAATWLEASLRVAGLD